MRPMRFIQKKLFISSSTGPKMHVGRQLKYAVVTISMARTCHADGNMCVMLMALLCQANNIILPVKKYNSLMYAVDYQL